MPPSPDTSPWRKAGPWSAALSALVGIALWLAPVTGNWFKALSFDLLSLARSPVPVPEVVLVTLDEDSFSRLGQSPDRLWDRALHTRLLDTLIRGGARAVVFDVFFAEPWPDPEVDARFAEALQRAKGKVVLGASRRLFEMGEALGARVLEPTARLAAAAPCGVVEMPQDPDEALRRHSWFPEHASLAWTAAELLGGAPPAPGRSRWLNYYGQSAFRQVSYWQALQPESLAPDIFSNKVVFVGKSQVITSRGGNSGDEYRTPLSRTSGQLLSGVEIQATAFVNLWRRDWLTEIPPLAEAACLIATGALFNFGLALLRPLRALGWAAAGATAVTFGALALFSFQHLWFSWVIVTFVQVPFAFGCSVLSFVLRAAQVKDIPDHALLRCVGRGGYGEVWLARDAIGGFHAVKIIYRRKFPRPEPFEREFHGMQTFAPLSRSHPGLVHILHVGRNDLRGCFYYIMEAADDELSGTDIHPERYTPRTLAGDITRHGRLPVSECLKLGVNLASALDHLHQRRLIHRDVKPANIIFVNGQPKLADVGLVTSVGGEPADTTRVGTAGYMAPEGPGTVAGDIYALGKTLYQAATGCECGRFPELPTALDSGRDSDALLHLHEILLTACETDPADRYTSAAAMRDALLELQRHLAASTAPAA